MLPLHDDNPTRLRPWVTWGLIGACVAIFLWQSTLPPGLEFRYVLALGAIPSVIVGSNHLPPELVLLPAWATPLSAAFLHGNTMHLIGNMLYLWVFGNNVEDSMGHGRFVVFYALCGVAAGLAHTALDVDSTVPMIGASGAVSGVLGAYILLYPRARVLFWAGFLVLRLPAVVVLGVWFLMQFAGLGASVEGGGVAYGAHLGGFVAGMVLIGLFKSSRVPFFAGRSAGPAPLPGATRRRSSIPVSGRRWRF
ncbi:Membrane associated serine protease, rhomboid family [Roseospirillum parvum]|uniref:Membrane associated serine protease, rhomboid family n=1 Tax=Roseospirillum parvum TaxID=83401 RepID=A0A1G7ZP32_9PROT|nr:Membrane associated serine protease, rhomboid family [Roseospirillum parvum]